MTETAYADYSGELGRLHGQSRDAGTSVVIVGVSGLVNRSEPPAYVLGPPSVLAKVRGEAPEALVWAATNPGEISWCLRMIGPVSSIEVDAVADEEAHQAVLDRTMLHLENDGYFQVGRDSLTTDESWERWCSFLLDLGRLALCGDAGDLSPRWRALGKHVGGVEVTERRTRVVRAGTALLKPPNAEATRVIATRARTSSVREVLREKGQRFTSLGTTHLHGATVELSGFETTFEVPDRVLRRYDGDVRLVERCLVTLEDMVIPESYRFPLEASRKNPRLDDIDHEFATVNRDWNESWDRLGGSFYHLDCSNSGHFGHLTTEVLSRLWGWEAAVADDPDVRAIFRIRRPGERDPRLEREIFKAYGIPESKIVWAPAPVRVDTLYAASPLWHNQFPHYADPRIVETWERLASALVTVGADVPERLFVSRRATTANRGCRNAPAVEAWFRAQGFTVVYPEDHSLSEQATMFAGARVVAGFAGSALFNVMFAKKLEKFIVLAHEAYTARNEHLYGTMLGCETHYVWSAPDIAHPPGGWSEAAYFSNWEFDFGKNEGFLRAVV